MRGCSGSLYPPPDARGPARQPREKRIRPKPKTGRKEPPPDADGDAKRPR